MKILNDFTEFLIENIKDLDSLEFRKAFIISIAAIFIFLSGSYYYLYSSTKGLCAEIIAENKNLVEIDKMKTTKIEIQKKEEIEQAFLISSKAADNLKSYLDQKFSKFQITADPKWKDKVKTTKWLIDDTFDQDVANITIPKCTTNQLTEFLQEVYMTPSIALRFLEIIKNQDGLTANLVFSYRYKSR